MKDVTPVRWHCSYDFLALSHRIWDVLLQDLAKGLESARLGIKMCIALKFGRCLGSSATKMPDKFQSDWKSFNHWSCAFQDFARSYNKTSHAILNWPPQISNKVKGVRSLHVQRMIMQNSGITNTTFFYVLANEKRYYICNAFSHWPTPGWDQDSKQV